MPTPPLQTDRRSRYLKVAVLLGGLLLAVVGWIEFAEELSLERLSAREVELRTLRVQHPGSTYAAALGLYVAVTALSLPVATVLTLAYGWFFGFWRAVVLVSLGATAGATIAFLVSRHLFRDALQHRFADRLVGINAEVQRQGTLYLFALRLIPAIPFFMVNLLMGLTPIRVRTFWWVSQIGMLPATALYVYAGSQVPTLEQLAQRGIGGVLTPELIIALTLLGVFPFAVKLVAKRFRAAGTPP